MKRLLLGLICLLCFACESTVSNPQEIPALIQQLNDKDERVRDNASLRLATLGTPAVIALAGALDEPDPERRIRIVQILHSMGPHAKAAIPALILALRQHRDYPADTYLFGQTYHGLVSDTLASIGSSAVPALTELLSDTRSHVRYYAVSAVENFFTNRARGWGIPALRGEADVESALDYALRVKGDSDFDVVPALIPLLDDDKEEVRQTAVEALGAIGQPASGAVPYLIPMLNDSSIVFRGTVAYALGRMGNHSVTVPALIQALEDNDEDIRASAALALGEIGSAAKEAVPILIKQFDTGTHRLVLGYEPSRFRISIVSGLAGIGTPSAVQKVKATVLNKDEATVVREMAASGLGRIGIERSQNGEDVEEIVLVLFDLLEEKEFLYFYHKCAAMLGAIGPPAIPALIKGLSHESGKVRKWSASALAVIGPAAHEAVGALVQAFSDENEQVKISAARALKAIGTPEALKAIEGFTEPLVPKVRVRRD